MDIDGLLTEQEKIFLSRAVKRNKLFLASSIATVVVALSFLVYHVLIAKDMNGLRFAVIIILLLSGRIQLGPEQEITHWFSCGILEDRYLGTLMKDDRNRLQFYADNPMR